MKPNTNLRDLAYMGGWKNPQTLLAAYQLPEMSVQREALTARTKVRASRDASPTDTTNGHLEQLQKPRQHAKCRRDQCLM